MERLVILRLIFLWTVIHVTWARNVHYEDVAYGIKDTDRAIGSLTCQCADPLRIKKRNFDHETAEKIFKEVAYSNNTLEKINGHPIFKDFMKDCHWCQLAYADCSETLCVKRTVKFMVKDKPGGALGNLSMKMDLNDTKTEVKGSVNFSNKVDLSHVKIENEGDAMKVIDNASAENLIRTVEIPVGGLQGNHSRQLRQIYLGYCSFPNGMDTAALSCRIFPSFVKCIQRCSFGYTLNDGIRQEKKCIKDEDTWTPSGFEECQPFVDCSVTMITGGSARCYSPTVSKNKICNIECLHYEDKPAISARDYKCSIDGSWDPPLPFCVIAGSGLALVSPPRIQLHDDYANENRKTKTAKIEVRKTKTTKIIP